MTPQTASPKSAARSEPLIYLGPTLPKQGLKHGTIFAGDVGDGVRTLIGKCPEIQELIVPAMKTAAVRQAVNEAGSPANQASAAIKAAFGGGER